MLEKSIRPESAKCPKHGMKKRANAFGTTGQRSTRVFFALGLRKRKRSATF